MKKRTSYLFALIGLLSIIGIVACMYLMARDDRQTAMDEGLPTLEEPLFSMPGGFYEEDFFLELSAPPGCQIYYTTDGSNPGPTCQLYEDPILISSEVPFSDSLAHWMTNGERAEKQSAKVIRAICVTPNGEKSKVITNTYFVGIPELAKCSVVSIVMDPEDLFGEQGIYTNYEGRGKEWERVINLEIFDPMFSPRTINQPAGIRIQGASARKEYAKRFSVFARKEYGGRKTFEEIFLGKTPIHAFVLREGFMNAFIQHLVQDRDIASADAKETYLFVNGCFWQATMMQEKYNSTYFEQHYGFQKDNVILIKGNEPETEEDGDLASFQSLYDYLRTHDLSDQAAYEGFQKLADVQSYIDFSCVNLYFGNLDFNEQKNIYYWRSRKPGNSPYEDCRWRWGLYDLDLENLNYGFFETDINTFSLDTHYAGSAFRTRETYVALRQNPQFCDTFVNTFMDLINTEFTLENAKKVYEDWNCTPAYWRKAENWCEDYFPARNEKITEFIREEFELSSPAATLQINCSDMAGGKITVNTITLASPGDAKPLSPIGKPGMAISSMATYGMNGSWQGQYFPGVPITLTATASKGYHFTKWLLNGEDYSTEPTILLNLSPSGDIVEAVFSANLTCSGAFLILL